MKKIKEKTIKIKDNRECFLRDVVPSDDKKIIEHSKTVITTSSPFMTISEDEIITNSWKVRSQLKESIKDPYSYYLVAEADGKIVATLTTFIKKRRRLSHSIEFGIGIIPSWQGSGLGRTMLEEFINWCDTGGKIKRIQLHVNCENLPAISLYEKLGFKTEGRLEKTVRFDDGSYTDDFLMSRLID